MTRARVPVVVSAGLSLAVLALLALAPAVPGTGDLSNEPAAGFSEGRDVFLIKSTNGIATTTFPSGDTIVLQVQTDRLSNVNDLNELRINDYLGVERIANTAAFSLKSSSGGVFVYEATVPLGGLAPAHYLVWINLRESGSGADRFETRDVIAVGGGDSPPKYIRTYRDQQYTTIAYRFNPEDRVFVEVWTGAGSGANARQSEVQFADYRGNVDTKRIEDLRARALSSNGEYSRFTYDLKHDPDALDPTEAWWHTISATMKRNSGEVVIQSWTIQIYINAQPRINSVTVSPSTQDVFGPKLVQFAASFTDLDAAGVDDFRVMFEVRLPDDTSTQTLADARNGQSGLMVESHGGGNFRAVYNWDPPDGQATGLYDVRVTVRDLLDGLDQDDFPDHSNVLTLTNSNVHAPSLAAGNTRADPSRVAVDSGTTTLRTKFSDTLDLDTSSFRCTFRLRNSIGDPLVLVNAQRNGGPGDGVLSSPPGTLTVIKFGVGTYEARYTLDPTGRLTSGAYDLYFRVQNDQGGEAVDDFNNNLGELAVTTSTPIAISTVIATPGSVTVPGDGMTQFVGEFTHTTNPVLTEFRVTFKVRDPNGLDIAIASDRKSGEPAETGGTVAIIQSGTGYSATVSWNPPDLALAGKYDLYFSVQDTTGGVNTNGFERNPDELELVGGSGAPELAPTDPQKGKGSNVYTFVVSYLDRENEAPNALGVQIVLDGAPHPMTPVNATDITFTDGKTYSYVQELAPGTHSYYFQATDAGGRAAKTPDLTVTAKKIGTTPATNNAALYGAIAALVIFVAILAVFVLMLLTGRIRRGSGGLGLQFGAAPPPAGGQHPHAHPQHHDHGTGGQHEHPHDEHPHGDHQGHAAGSPAVTLPPAPPPAAEAPRAMAVAELPAGPGSAPPATPPPP